MHHFILSHTSTSHSSLSSKECARLALTSQLTVERYSLAEGCCVFEIQTPKALHVIVSALQFLWLISDRRDAGAIFIGFQSTHNDAATYRDGGGAKLYDANG